MLEDGGDDHIMPQLRWCGDRPPHQVNLAFGCSQVELPRLRLGREAVAPDLMNERRLQSVFNLEAD